MLPDGAIGLHSLSTIDRFCDERMLTNIRRAAYPMRINCNDGKKEVKDIDHLAGYGNVRFDRTAVGDILSLGSITKRFKVTLDSEGGGGFIIHLAGGRTRRFKPTARGLYAMQFLNTRNHGQGVALTIATVDGNKKRFTK